MDTNAELQTLSESDENLCNILTAIGPGEGIRAPQITLIDEASVELYGPYPKVETFADAAGLEDLRRLAALYLADHADPLESLGVRAVFEQGVDLRINRGDTVRFAHRETGINVTERIAQIDYDDEGATFSLKAPPASLVGAMLDPAEAEDRKRRQLGLPPPEGFTVTGARPGVRLKYNPYVGSRAQGVEIHAALEPNFEPTTATLVRRTPDTEVHLSTVPGLPLGARWFVKVASYAGDELGEFTPEAAAIAGYITTDVLDPAIEQALDQSSADEAVAALRDELTSAQIYTGTVTAHDLQSVSDGAQDWGALGVRVGWALRFTSGPLIYQQRTVVGVSGPALVLDPPLPALDLTGAGFEVGSSSRITTLGATDVVVELNKTPDTAAFSAIKQMSDQIALAVVRDAEQYSLLTQLEDELDLRVVKGDMISSLNLDPAGVRIAGRRISLDGDTQINGNLAITGGNSAYGNRVRVLDSGNGEQVALGYLEGLPWGEGTLPANTWGIWGSHAGVYLRGTPRILAAGTAQITLAFAGGNADTETQTTGSAVIASGLVLRAGAKLHTTAALAAFSFNAGNKAALSGIYVRPRFSRNGGAFTTHTDNDVGPYDYDVTLDIEIYIIARVLFNVDTTLASSKVLEASYMIYETG